jgi:hypothetical protein
LPVVAGWTARLINAMIAAFKALQFDSALIQFDSAQSESDSARPGNHRLRLRDPS